MAARVKLTWAILGVAWAFASQAMAQTMPATTTAMSPSRFKLWPMTPDIIVGNDAEDDPTEPTIDVFLPPAGKASGTAIIVLPGGGYTHLSTVKEGTDVARMLVEHHVAAFVLRYRHAPRYKYPVPMMDATRAMRWVRSRASEYHVDEHRIGILGFSAGGHLAATAATQFDAGKPDADDPVERVGSRPDFAVLVYPVITFTVEKSVHRGSRQALVGTDEKLWEAMSAERNVSSQTPPTFLVHASTDRTVPVENSILFYQACLSNRVPAEIHLFEAGPHGFGLAPTDAALRTWPDLLMTWMNHHQWLTPVVAPALNSPAKGS